MKKKFTAILTSLSIVAAMGFVLASNKAKIDKAATPVKTEAIIPVKAYTVKLDSFNTAFSINGTTSPAREVKIASEVQGKLVALYIHNGDMITAGQVIATLDASVYHMQLRSVDAAIAKAALDLKRYTTLIQLGGATPMQAESAQLQINSLVAEKHQVLQQIDHMQIRAPFSGRVENVTVEVGSFVGFGTVLAQLIDISSLKINVYLSEQEAVKIQLNQPVTINSVVLKAPKSGKVSAISDKADASGKFLTEISFDNSAEEKMKAGMIADVAFTIDATEEGLSIPAGSLTGSAKDAKVFVIKGNRVELRAIKTGIVTSDKVQVVEGLSAGDQVVISGQLNLEHGSPIKINQ